MMIQMPSHRDGEARPSVPMVMIGSERWRFPVEQASEAVGGRLTALVGWDEVTDHLAQHSCAVLIVETSGIDIDTLATALPRIDAFAAALDIPVVVGLEEEAIDVVAATMLTACAQLLCAPTTLARAAALAIAVEQRGALLVGDSVREGEAVRLQRLNEEVARIAETLARLTRRDAEDRNIAATVSDHPTPFRQRQPSDVVIDAAEVRRAIRARRLRDQRFGAGLFEDPGWDILLDLFAADLEGTQVSVSSLCIAASVAPTTALRWIAKLTDSGMLERRPDPFDRRRAFMELSSSAGQAMREHVGALRRAGLPFG